MNQTLDDITDIRQKVASNIAYLLSVIRCGETLSYAEEAVVRRNVADLMTGGEGVDRLLVELVSAWDAYRMGDVARFMAVARERVGLTVPERNKDR